MRRRSPADARLSGLGLSDSEKTALGAASTIVDVPFGTALCRQGRTGTQMIWILDGTADVVRSGALVAQVGPGDVVGEMAIIGTRVSCSADVVATSQMTIVVQSRREWQLAGHRAPSLVTKLTELATAREVALAV